MSDSPVLSFHSPIRAVQLLLTHPNYFWLLVSLVIIGDVTLTQLIIRFIPCQTLDLFFPGGWSHYMRLNRHGN